MIVVFILAILIVRSSFGQREKAGGQLVDLIRQTKKTIVFLGAINEKGKIQLRATGFLVMIQNVFHLVTAKHVIMETKGGKFTGKFIDNNMFALFNMKDGHTGLRSISQIKSKYGANWIFHQDENVDIAIIPFPLDLKKQDVMVIPDKMFLTADRVFELYDVYFLSYQPGIGTQEQILPVIRSGTVSLINKDNTFYIDGFAFPGNSGSPVFLKPSLIRFDEKGDITIGVDPLGGKFIGIVGEYIPYQEVAISTQTNRPRVVFEENTGLSKVWSVKFLKEIEDSAIFKQQLQRLLPK